MDSNVEFWALASRTMRRTVGMSLKSTCRPTAYVISFSVMIWAN
jgi:hypothetical protein